MMKADGLLRRGMGYLDVLLKAEQFSLFGDAPVFKPGGKSPAGYEPIPGSKHGGFRKRNGNRFDYWYPSTGHSDKLKGADLKHMREKHDEHEKMLGWYTSLSAPDMPEDARAAQREASDRHWAAKYLYEHGKQTNPEKINQRHVHHIENVSRGMHRDTDISSHAHEHTAQVKQSMLDYHAEKIKHHENARRNAQPQVAEYHRKAAGLHGQASRALIDNDYEAHGKILTSARQVSEVVNSYTKKGTRRKAARPQEASMSKSLFSRGRAIFDTLCKAMVHRPPGAGWAPAPHSKHGSYRKRGPQGWVYWSATRGMYAETLLGETEVPKVDTEHAARESQALLDAPEVASMLTVAERALHRFGEAGTPVGVHPKDALEHIRSLAGQVAHSRDLARIHAIQDKAKEYAQRATADINASEKRQRPLFGEEETDVPQSKPELSRADLHRHAAEMQRHSREMGPRAYREWQDALKIKLGSTEFLKVKDRQQELAREEIKSGRAEQLAARGEKKVPQQRGHQESLFGASVVGSKAAQIGFGF